MGAMIVANDHSHRVGSQVRDSASQSASNMYGSRHLESQSTRASDNDHRDSQMLSSTKSMHATVLEKYQLGDCLGKGAFGSVYRALNMDNGETVAVKQIRVAELPKSELRVITSEIDLLKNLDHPNIVKYRGCVKSPEVLNIILEYCENGSLHSISKNFGKFPETLVGIYMSQVLHGLLYLHEQGVIHRDIKGANILTTKQGLVKLADFGVATRTTAFHESSVVGTPYWMAPEVIELSGATTASDIWSLGCTVIELLDGKPPYHKLQPMHALFRIVNDDHPPLPEGASPVVRDFLMQCFQKDSNLRVSARKLLKHPWIVNAKQSDAIVPKKPTEYNEAVKSVQEWNEALKAPDPGSLRKVPRPVSSSPKPYRVEAHAVLAKSNKLVKPIIKAQTLKTQTRRKSSRAASDNNWDDDFATDTTSHALNLSHFRPHDNFSGLLTAEKLKSFASSEVGIEESNWDENFEGDLTIRSPRPLGMTDAPHKIRPSTLQHDPKRQGIVTQDGIPQGLDMDTIPATCTWLVPGQRQIRNTEQQVSRASLPRASTEIRSSNISNHMEPPSPRCAVVKTLDGFLHDSHHSSVPHPHLRTIEATGLSENGQYSTLLPGIQPMAKRRATVGIHRYAEDETDEDFSDVLGKVRSIFENPGSECSSNSDRPTMILSSKLSNNSWLGDNDDDDDPFAQLEEGFDVNDLEANVARDKYARVCTQVEGLVDSLKLMQADDVLATISDQLLHFLTELPETKAIVITAHGMLPILEILEGSRRRDLTFNLLRIVNTMMHEDVETQENLCFVGGIPIITTYASKKYPSEIRLEAATFIRQMCQTSGLTLQMFVSAGGLKVLVEFLEEDYEEERELVLIGVNGIWSVFELQGPTPKNDFCRILSRNAVLDPLSLVLSRVLDEEGELAEICEGRIANIFFLFSQAENHVKELIAERTILHRVLKELRRMSPEHQVTMLKFVKNLSMLSTTLDSLQNSNAIDVLSDLLRSTTDKPHYREISNQILNTLYNLCRLNKSRQEDAALNGIIPILQRIIETKGPLKEFALPVLCDMANSGKVGRRELWRNKGLAFYISLLSDEFWQVTALDAVFVWLQEETAKVEEHLLDGAFTLAIVKCFTTAKANAFENLLEPLQKLLRLSPPIAISMAKPDLFARVFQKLQSGKAFVRLNLLRIVRSICEASDENRALLAGHGLHHAIRYLADNDSAVLVRNMAGELLKACETHEIVTPDGNRRNHPRRITSSGMSEELMKEQPTTTTPTTPTTPTSTQALKLMNYRAHDSARLNAAGSQGEVRNVLRRSLSTVKNVDNVVRVHTNPTKSRLPRTAGIKPPREQEQTLPTRIGQPNAAKQQQQQPMSSPAPNSRRRRQPNKDEV